MKLSIIIPTHCRAHNLELLLQTIAAQDFTEKFEVIVITNIEGDASEQVVERFQEQVKNLFFEVSGQLGVNIARNIGMERARGEILVFLDDDVRLSDCKYFRNVVKAHEENPNAVGIGGRYKLMEPATNLVLAYHLTCDLWLLQSRLMNKEALNLVGGNASYKRLLLDRNFRFEGEIFFGGTETQFNARLIKAKQSLLLLDSLPVEHDVRVGVREFFYRAFRQGATRRRILLEGFDTEFRFHHQNYSRRKQISVFLPDQKIGRSTVPLLRLFDFAFELGFEWAGIALYEDRKWRIIRKLTTNRLWAIVLLLRRNTLLWSIAQATRISWPQRTRFNFSWRHDT